MCGFCKLGIIYSRYSNTTNYEPNGWYNWGSEVDWRDTANIRKWDVVIFKSKKRSGGHIGFIQEITSNGVIKVLGGNQGNNAKVSNYQFNSKSQYVKSIKRNWSLPAEFDKPIDGTQDATTDSRYNSIMPGQIHRKDDENDAGAKITSTKQTAVKVGGQPVATDGDPVAGPVIRVRTETANGNRL